MRTALMVAAAMFCICGGAEGGVHAAAVDFPSLVMTRRCPHHLGNSHSRRTIPMESDDSSPSSSFHAWWRRKSILPLLNTSWLHEWMNDVTRDVQERSLRFEEYWTDCDSAPQWVQWLFSGACYKRLSLSVPWLTRNERFTLQSWGQCMAPTPSSSNTNSVVDANHRSWATEDLVAMEQAVETLACSSSSPSAAVKRILHLNALGRVPLSLLWIWFRFRNEYLLPLLLGKDRFEAAFPLKTSSPSSSSSVSRTLASMTVMQSRNVQRACRCLLPWERILFLLALMFVGVVALVQEAMGSSSSSRMAYSNRNRMAARPPTNNDDDRTHSPTRQQVHYAHHQQQHHSPLPRRSRRIQRHATRLFREPADYDPSSLFRVSVPNNGYTGNSSSSSTKNTNSFRPRRLPVLLESRVRYETDCPCCFQDYQVSPPEFNDSARLPILSDACIHSYCLDCATRDREMVMKRQVESLSLSAFAFPSSASLSARTTRTALSYLYGMDNDEDDFDHDDDDYSSMLLLHRAVRCPFCREPDAFEVDRPILRPDAYAAYRKQKLEREEQIKRQILLW
jgi:hypothetical protein